MYYIIIIFIIIIIIIIKKQKAWLWNKKNTLRVLYGFTNKDILTNTI